jgi:hypothetical protein
MGYERLMAQNNGTMKVTDKALVFFIKLKHNVKTVRMDTEENILKVKEPSTPEVMDFMVDYFKTHNKEYQEMIKTNVKRTI